MERLERETGRRLRRPVMIHAQLVGRDQLPRLKALGMIPSFFVAHVYHWGEDHVKNLPERAEHITLPVQPAPWGFRSPSTRTPR